MTAKNRALIMVDLQNDFCAGGSLAIPEGDLVVPIANRLQACFDRVVATQDWHPRDHLSFASNHPGRKVGDLVAIEGIQQVLWPDHCVQGSHGAAFYPTLDISRVNKIVHKGTDKKIDSYSAFYDNAHLRSTGLDDYLKAQGVAEVYILGLATDYCVKFSALDAVWNGFTVYVVEDACRGVELHIGDVAAAIREMREAGVKMVQSREVSF